MAKNIIIGCKLPHGIVLKGMNGQDITINGMNTARVLGGFGLTTVEENEGEYLVATYGEHAAFQSEAIFNAGSGKVADVLAMGRELADEKTGFEGMDPDKPAAGMAPETNVGRAIEDAARAPRPVKVPQNDVDKALAAEVAGS